MSETRIVVEQECRHWPHQCPDEPCPEKRRRVLTPDVIESVASDLDDRLGPGLWRTYITAILDALAKSEQDNP